MTQRAVRGPADHRSAGRHQGWDLVASAVDLVNARERIYKSQQSCMFDLHGLRRNPCGDGQTRPRSRR